MERYHRQQLVPGFGAEGQQRLAAARVLVVGAGGLGCPVLSYLAAAGVGQLIVADADRVSESNLHRQLLYTPADVGRLKVEVAREMLLRQNSSIRIEAIAEDVTMENADALIERADVVVDGSDRFETRYLVNDRCVRLGKPLVSGSVFQVEGQLAVFNSPPGLGPDLRDLYPTVPTGAEAMACDEGGVLGPLPGAIGSLMALEVIKLLTGLGEQLPSGRGTLLVLDGLSLRTQTLSFAASADNPLRDPSWQPDAEYYTQFCSRGVVDETSSFSLSAQRVTSMLAAGDAQLLDVRSAPERALLSFGGEHIPLGELARRLDEHELDLEMGSPIIVYCASGVRSRSAVALLRQQGYEAYDIAGGLKAYLAARAARSAALGR